jgi:hypothetical protein
MQNVYVIKGIVTVAPSRCPLGGEPGNPGSSQPYNPHIRPRANLAKFVFSLDCVFCSQATTGALRCSWSVMSVPRKLALIPCCVKSGILRQGWAESCQSFVLEQLPLFSLFSRVNDHEMADGSMACGRTTCHDHAIMATSLASCCRLSLQQ